MGVKLRNNASPGITNCPQKAKSGFPHRLCGGKFSRFGAQAPFGSLISLGIRDQVDQAVGTEADFEAFDRPDRRGRWKYGGRWADDRGYRHISLGIADRSHRNVDQQAREVSVSAENRRSQSETMKFFRILLIFPLSLAPSCSSLDYGYDQGYKDGHAAGVLDGIQMTTL
jgi:hypothetical protein